jgi:hypothetical protein
VHLSAWTGRFLPAPQGASPRLARLWEAEDGVLPAEAAAFLLCSFHVAVQPCLFLPKVGIATGSLGALIPEPGAWDQGEEC